MTKKLSKEKCMCEPIEILIFPCSGGSNVGQIANEAAKRLTTSKKGKMYCLAGIGGHISGIIESTKAAKKVIAIDGCLVHCAKKTLEHAGIPVNNHIIVTDLNIEKNYALSVKSKSVGLVVKAVVSKL